MKQFNLKEYLKNPSRQVVTRNGLPARIVCTNAKCDYPVVALVMDGDTESTFNFTADGLYLEDEETFRDLFFKPLKCEGWVNVYMASDGTNKRTGAIYDTEEEAMQHCSLCEYVGTVHVEWEVF